MNQTGGDLRKYITYANMFLVLRMKIETVEQEAQSLHVRMFFIPSRGELLFSAAGFQSQQNT